MDLLTPVGKGQRGLIVSPPRTGKTMLLQNVANSITTNHPEVVLIVLLIDERPEEVTDMQRSVKGEVSVRPLTNRLPATFRWPRWSSRRPSAWSNTSAMWSFCWILLPGWRGPTIRSCRPAARFFPAASTPTRCRRPSDSSARPATLKKAVRLTIIATALVDTGSRMDDVIFEEFKGTGNMEIILDRKLVDKRVFPAIDIQRSGTQQRRAAYPQGRFGAHLGVAQGPQSSISG